MTKSNIMQINFQVKVKSLWTFLFILLSSFIEFSAVFLVSNILFSAMEFLIKFLLCNNLLNI